ncbi:hypothetical protein LMG7974_00217 [Campylobacter majalis]|uniref:Zona occludens toxin N-terminal domain-containing protein n=1 Tax=Campylobacter majalis TaxID=2790656 RepID=A0ABM8Q373_9BACT|nr:zonular occludens toxin domain-containing protein [Campylobacter majalis]CAD7287282.1 hypothetical protein LMG7974_00217 [Campylobacter majalis]
MITYIIGNPGSGKTYYAVYMIYETFLKKPKQSFITRLKSEYYRQKNKSSKSNLKNEYDENLALKNNKLAKYKYCYTNINQFKFELDERFIKFDFEKFYDDLSILYAHYQDKATDEQLNEVAKELKLHNVIFVIDEAHNVLKSKKDEVLIWWLTYHRHLYQDIYLITQDLSLINNEYKRIAEFFYKAVDSSKRLFGNKFRYVVFGSYKMFKKDEYKKVHVDFLNEVFSLYHSGQTNNGKSIVKKFLLIALFLFVFVVVYFIMFVSSLKSQAPKDTQDNNKQVLISNSYPDMNSSLSASPNVIINEPNENLYLYYVICFNSICTLKGFKETFPESFVSYLVTEYQPLYYMPITNNSSNDYFFVFNKPYLEILKNLNKGSNDEKASSFSAPKSLFN